MIRLQFLFPIQLAFDIFSAPPADRRSPAFIKRIFLLIIFIIISRNVADSVICIPSVVSPFFLYLLGFIVAGAVAKTDLTHHDGGPMNPDGEPPQLQQQQRTRRRSAMSSVSSSLSNDRSLPSLTAMSSSAPQNMDLGSSGGGPASSGTRGRRTSLPALSANVHRHRVSHEEKRAVFTPECCSGVRGGLSPDFLTRICRISFMFLSCPTEWACQNWLCFMAIFEPSGAPWYRRLSTVVVGRRRCAGPVWMLCAFPASRMARTRENDFGPGDLMVLVVGYHVVWEWETALWGSRRGRELGIESIEPSFCVMVVGALEARRWTFRAGNTLLL